MVPGDASPYDAGDGAWTKTFALPLYNLQIVNEIRYNHPTGAIGTVLFR